MQLSDLKVKQSTSAQGWSRIAEDKRHNLQEEGRADAHLALDADKQQNEGKNSMVDRTPLDNTGRPIMVPGRDPNTGAPTGQAEPFVARDAEAGKAAAKAASQHRLRSEHLEEYKKLAGVMTYQGPGPNSENAKKAEKAREQVIKDLSEEADVPESARTYDILEKRVPPPKSVLHGDPTGELEQLGHYWDSKVDEAMGTAGYPGSYSKDFKSHQDLGFKPGATKGQIDQKGQAGLPADPNVVGPPAPAPQMSPEEAWANQVSGANRPVWTGDMLKGGRR
jgi:hypothetical protein